MTADWNNLYLESADLTAVTSDDTDAVYQLAQYLIEKASAHDGSITRSGILEAMAIAKTVLSIIDKPGHSEFVDMDGHDINSNASLA